jgi:hypothetical protein
MALSSAYLANHLVFLLHCFCNDLYYFKDPKTPNITQFGALAGQIQHMVAQRVGFMLRPIGYGSPSWYVSSSAALECQSNA